MSDETNIEKLRLIGDALIDPEFAVQLFEDGYPDGLVVVDMTTGMIKLVNKHLERLFGYHRSELYDKCVDMLVPASVQSKHEAHRIGYRSDPQPRPMGLGRILQGRHKSGLEFDIEISLSPIIARQGAFVVAAVRKRR